MSASAVQPAVSGIQETHEENGGDQDARWKPVLALPCELAVDLPIVALKLRDFLSLHPGSVINTGWGVTRDVPVRVNGTVIGWGEMESIGSHLSVRLTELA